MEKTRKLLTANKETDVHIECLMEDIDINRKISREEFEKIIASPIMDLRKTLMMALSRAGISTTQIDSVELVGEATRIPAVQSAIQFVF
jgi:heat shock protein 4